MFTSLCIYAPAMPHWVPDDATLAQLLTYFSPTAVTVWGHDGPLLWDAENQPGPTHIRDCATVAEAVEAAHQMQCATTCFFLKAHQWSERVRNEFQDRPGLETYEHFAPCCVSVTVGPQSLPDPTHTRTAAQTSFALALGGDGMPKDLQHYRAAALESESIASLIGFLAKVTGVVWDITFDCTY